MTEAQASLAALNTAAASSPTDCPMMRAFGRDTGSCFRFTEFLILNELAQLVGCCSVWRAWLAAPRSIAPRMRELPPSSLPLFSSCEWARQHVVSVVLLEGEPAQLDAAFTLLPLFRRLQVLSLTTRGQLIEEAIFERCFAAAKQTLTQIEITLPTAAGTEHNDAIVQSCINQCKQLSKLKDLRITGTIARASDIDFSPISALLLKTIRIGRPASNYCLTGEQTKQICLIPTLTTVDLGAWLLPADARMVDGVEDASASTIIQRGIGKFTRSRQQGAAPLRFLQLTQSLMTTEFFTCLCAVPSLESIWPKRWRAGMTSDDWKQLRLFTSLRKLSVCPESENEQTRLMTVDDVLDGLGHCPTLTEIQLGTGYLLRPQHVQQIAQNLPALGCLVLFHCRVQSLAALVDAPSLTALDLRCCMDHEGGPPHWRITLPSLPRLTDLIIVDRDGSKLTPKQADPLNVALLARMPSLTPAKFTQNLLPEEAEDGDA